MDKKKTKKAYVVAGAVAVVLIATATVTIYYFYKNYIPKVPLAEIISNSDLPNKEYENLDFSEAVLNLPDAEKLYNFYIPHKNRYTPKECTERCYEMFDLVFDFLKDENKTFSDFDGNPLSDGEAKYSYLTTGGFSEASIDCFVSDEEYYECRFAGSGRFIIYSRSSHDPINLDNVNFKEVVHLDRGEKAPDTKYLVDGEEYSPAQALEFAEKVMSDKISKFIEDTPVSATEIIIREDPDSGNCVYTIQFEFVYDGLPYFHLALPNSLDGKLHIGNGVIYINIASPDRIYDIYNMMDNPIIENDGALEDKYIQLDKAADLASEYLAPNFVQHISEVTIKYTCSYEVTDFNSYEDMNEKLKQKNDDDNRSYLSPCWCFIIDKNDPVAYTNFMIGNVILVDMQTGEVTAYIDT